MNGGGRTRIKAPERNESLPIPAAPHRAPLEAHERAPTLLASTTPGASGSVVVFGPRRWRIVGTAGASALGIGLLIGSAILDHTIAPLGFPLMAMIAAFGGSIAALRRPCYITMDHTGIGVTTAVGSHTLRWTEIWQVERLKRGWSDFGICRIRLTGRDSDPADINLCGYTRREIRILLKVIASRADLEPDPACKHLWLRRARPPEVSAAIRSLPGVRTEQGASSPAEPNWRPETTA